MRAELRLLKEQHHVPADVEQLADHVAGIGAHSARAELCVNLVYQLLAAPQRLVPAHLAPYPAVSNQRGANAVRVNSELRVSVPVLSEQRTSTVAASKIADKRVSNTPFLVSA